MSAPLILATGMMRSGSTWAFNVCRLAGQLVAQHLNQPFASAYLLDKELDEFLAKQFPTLPGPAVIKAHFVGHAALNLIAAGRVKCVSTYRDPRDCVASLMTFTNDPFQRAMRRTTGFLEELTLYQQSRNTLLIRYEDMIRDTAAHVRMVTDYLGVQLDDAGIRWIDGQTNIDRAREVSAELKTRPDDAVVRQESHRVDPATNLHDNHIHSGKVGRWRDELTPEQQETLAKQFRPWLISLGYETETSLEQAST